MLLKLYHKFCCGVGWHTFKWNLAPDDVVYLDDMGVPDYATCIHCGIKYGD